MDEILEVVVPWTLSIVLLFTIVHRDEARLSSEALGRAWPVATRRSALVYFGVLALPVHFGRTRRSVQGVLLGVGWGVLVAVVDELTGLGVEALAKAVQT